MAPPRKKQCLRNKKLNNRTRMNNARQQETAEEREAMRVEAAARMAELRASQTEEVREEMRVEAAARMAALRASQTEEVREEMRVEAAARMTALRASQTEEVREEMRIDYAARRAFLRASQSQEIRDELRVENSARRAVLRASQSVDIHDEINVENTARIAESRNQPWREKENSAFAYDPNTDYETDISTQIGSMSVTCNYCEALRWKGESPGLCCSNGKVRLPNLTDPPEPLRRLLTGDSAEEKQFQNNIRRYNGCFQMTSFGTTKEIKEPGFMPTFKVQGQVYHRIGSLQPAHNDEPKFLQIYFVADKQQQAALRCRTINHTSHDIVSQLQDMLHRENRYVQSFRCAIENMTPELNLVIYADKTPTGQHERRFNAPTTSEVAVIMAGDEQGTRDIVLQLRNNTTQRIADTHRSYDALQYPLIFWQGEDGYHFLMRQTNPATGMQTSKKISAMDFYAYRMMKRLSSFNIILRCKELFHQFAVDMFAKIESERLRYIRLNQKKLRVENYVHLRDAMNGDENVANVGQLIILPSSFTGGPRYMHERTQDAMTYVRNYGRPDLFITFTCNPNWIEVVNELITGQKTYARHDLLARVFRQKLKVLMNLLNKGKIFGSVQCFMYTVEWQKRGLPHAHLLVWLQEKIHVHRLNDFISAEIPNPDIDTALHNVVKTQMIHGPCGSINPRSPCMKEGKCTKGYPKKFLSESQTGHDGYPLYRRRKPEEGGFTTTLSIRGSHLELDNRWVVPYCPLLSRIFSAHINVEYCNSVKSIKYVCKYVNKGTDMAVFGLISPENLQNEVQQYQIGRYISTNEAIWRILNFPIHERHPTVIHLSVHLENGQRVYFTAENAHERSLAPPNTTLTAFFNLCQDDEFARTLLYHQVPKFYTWNPSAKKWARRKTGQVVPGHTIRSSDALGRVYTIHPTNFECFHLRLLLHEVKGPRSFEDLKKVGDIVCETFKQACQLRGLLENDDHWRTTLEEAASTRSPAMLRNLFAVMLQTCSMSNPQELWNIQKENMSEDILYQTRVQAQNEDLNFDDFIFNQALMIIEDKIKALGGSDLKSFGLPETERGNRSSINYEVLKEMSYNISDLAAFIDFNEPKLIRDQREAFDKITDAVFNGAGGIFFLDAPGGTGKTFLINLLLAKVRHRKIIALAVASSGIAATLLTGGKTAHSAFKLPLNLQSIESPTCNISRSSDKAKVLQKCQLIVWDECTMSHKAAFEALDATMQDVRRNDRLMGGAVLVLSGDFRQTLPVIPRGTKADEMQACVKTSHIWGRVQRLRLTTNMRVLLTGESSTAQFAENLLRLGNGQITYDNADGTISVENIGNIVTTPEELKDSVFPNLDQHFQDHTWLCQRAILAPRNDAVNMINKDLLSKLPGSLMTYKSVDTVTEINQAVHYPTEFLNSLEPSGVPPHKLELKIGAPIILLRNIDAPTLCNGTRLTVKKLMPNVIEATILTGHAVGTDVFIPRIPIIPSDVPFQFNRLQFPVNLSFAMSINKAQGQSLKVVGLNLLNPCFSHGQLYVGCSRVGDNRNLFILTPNGRTKNIVYTDILQQ